MEREGIKLFRRREGDIELTGILQISVVSAFSPALILEIISCAMVRISSGVISTRTFSGFKSVCNISRTSWR